MKKSLVILVVAFCIALVCAAPILSVADSIRAAFVADVDETTHIVTFVDGCGISWEWEEEKNIEKYDILDLWVFPLYGEEITKSVMGEPDYSGIRVDKEYAINILLKNHPQYVDNIIN